MERAAARRFTRTRGAEASEVTECEWCKQVLITCKTVHNWRVPGAGTTSECLQIAVSSFHTVSPPQVERVRGDGALTRCRRAQERAARAPTASFPLSPTPDWTNGPSSAAPRAARPTPPSRTARRCYSSNLANASSSSFESKISPRTSSVAEVSWRVS